MTPIPEPAADVRAQIEATLDSAHPKAATFVVPGNEAAIDHFRDHPGIHIRSRSEGTLVTADAQRAAIFEGAADDITMAGLLGYPEHKAEVVRNCGGNPLAAKAVQARDGGGNVVTEAFASPQGLQRTVDAITAHVPAGGSLVILTPVEAIARRLMLRAAEAASTSGYNRNSLNVR